MIHLKVDPPALSASLKAVRSLGHILAECVSNSVRHGNASRIEISVLGAAEKLLVSVSDNGFGCKDLQGSYTASELVQKKAGPLSLMDRVADAEGTLTLETSSEGTTIRLELSTW
jgi:two-component system sensor histidine kinase DesK